MEMLYTGWDPSERYIGYICGIDANRMLNTDFNTWKMDLSQIHLIAHIVVEMGHKIYPYILWICDKSIFQYGSYLMGGELESLDYESRNMNLPIYISDIIYPYIIYSTNHNLPGSIFRDS